MVTLVNPDDLAELEEQRSFLKRSLDDLERELAAGDIGPDDAETLRHDYAERLATVDAAIESGHVELVRNAPPRRPGRAVAILVVITVLAVGLGFGAAHFLGSRGAGESATGNIRESTADRLQRAEDLSTKGKILEALKLYDRVLDGDPENVDALVGRGLTLVRATMATGRTNFAADGQTFIERALTLQPNDPVILFYLGLSLRLQGKTDDARAAIDRALAANPTPALRTQIEQFESSLER
jgi:cytochrome c-type biogenesis protein CcmH/NrfG